MKLVVIRHGESVWNKENIFTGWVDVGLSKRGEEEAANAGKLLKEKGFVFDLAHTSVLKRAIDTLDIILKEMELEIPVKRSWRLNERFYGALQGQNKDQVREKYGEEQFRLWRRSYETRPPAITRDSEMYPAKDEKYKELKEEEIPLTESLKDTEARVLPYLNNEIFPDLKKGKKIIISAHGNSIRAMVKILENVSGEEIAETEIPMGIPLVYELDENLRITDKYYLE
ncbi:MAG: 2,3-diphosphoglycerate-dependent phosphoglycerate mutase [Candidatus Pacebacteria bacterium]|nr:2,3-diphosphoglycerate-dependent phosphoglycerate mutase [Candidatus Paceibacterota bacterium]MDD5555304.1 2,3-diphosphoglycerate-dependent phosphoglycerate mutase [Candidatus Paceibacterota bacterium]